MAKYEATDWKDNSTPAINADNLKKIENALVNLSDDTASTSTVDATGLVAAINECLADTTGNLRITTSYSNSVVTFKAE